MTIHKLMDELADNYERQRGIAAAFCGVEKSLRLYMELQPEDGADVAAFLDFLEQRACMRMKQNSGVPSPETPVESDDVTAAVAEMPLPAAAAVIELPTWHEVTGLVMATRAVVDGYAPPGTQRHEQAHKFLDEARALNTRSLNEGAVFRKHAAQKVSAARVALGMDKP